MRTLEIVAVQAVRGIGGFPLAGVPVDTPHSQLMAVIDRGNTLAMACYYNGQFQIREIEDAERHAAILAALENETPGIRINWVAWWSIPRDSEYWMEPRPLRVIGED